MAYKNMCLSERARFHSSFVGLTAVSPDTNKRLFLGKYKIVAERVAEFFVNDHDYDELGEMLVFNLRGPISEITPPEEREVLIESMQDGRHTFITLAPEDDLVKQAAPRED
jgi:hypothetical protein